MQQSAAAQFFQGLTAPLRGLSIVLRSKSMWALTLGPILLTGLMLVGAIFLAASTAGPATHWLLPSLENPFLLFAVKLLLGGLFGMLYGALAYMSAALLSLPLHDALSERIEDHLGRLPPAMGFWEALPRSIAHSAVGFLVWLVLQILLLPAQLVPGIGSLVGTLLGFLVTAFFLAHQLVDGPMSRRAMTFEAKMIWLRDHLPWVMGIGSLGTFVMMVPVLNLVGLPLLIAGGAVLWVELLGDD